MGVQCIGLTMPWMYRLLTWVYTSVVLLDAWPCRAGMKRVAKPTPIYSQLRNLRAPIYQRPGTTYWPGRAGGRHPLQARLPRHCSGSFWRSYSASLGFTDPPPGTTGGARHSLARCPRGSPCISACRAGGWR